MKKHPLLSIFILLFWACSSPKPNLENTTKPPHIILFYADDLGWMDLGIQGSPYYETPNIDQIAQNGMRFTNAYANAANCAPSRACLMTGVYPPRHGIYTVGKPDRGAAENRKLIPATNNTILDTTLPSLPSQLKQQGYKTAIAGKWHLSNDPLDYGFDANFGGYQAGHPNSYFSPYSNPFLEDGPEGEHLPDRLAKELVDWIKQQKDNPFFVYFPFYSVHTPIQARTDLEEKYKGKSPGQYHDRADYAAMIEAMDQAVGRVMTAMDQLELLENTIVVFTSDNGAYGPATLSRPLRGSKGMYYEGGIRVPFLVQWPKTIGKGIIESRPIIGMDLFPTFIELSGGTVPSFTDGQSLVSLFQGRAIPDRSLFWHFPAYLQMYKKDRAFEDSHDKPWFRTTPVSLIRKGDWKLLEFFEDGSIELYNLKKDIGEQQNLAAQETLKKEELYQELQNWQAQLKAAIPTEKNPLYEE